MPGGSPGKLRGAAHAVFEGEPSAESLGAFGLTPEDYDEDPAYEVWPDNWAGFQLFYDNITQWIQGMGGPTGLNYLVIFAELDRLKVEGEDREDMMFCIRELERGALEKMSEGRE